MATGGSAHSPPHIVPAHHRTGPALYIVLSSGILPTSSSARHNSIHRPRQSRQTFAMDTNRSNGNDDYDEDGDVGDDVVYDDGDNVEYDDGDNADYDGGDDNFNVEDDVEADAQDDQIPENHYKMVAFQTAIQAVLERQIEKLQLEVNENARLVTIGTKESQEAAKHLHDEQKCLVLEEDNVRSAAERLDRTQSRRERREKENREYKAEVERSEADLEQRIVNNEQLRAEVNDLTGQSLRYQLRRLEVEGEVGVDQACSDKGEQDFKVAQEAKQFQDKYIGKSRWIQEMW